MLSNWQMWAIAGVGIVIFGKPLVTKGFRSVFETKREVEKIMDEENKRNEENKTIPSN